MDEEKVRSLVRAEIVKAFQLVSDAASNRTGYGCGELESSAAYVVIGAMSSAISGLTPTEPEPVNPFAPKRTPQEWADAIKALIAEADADGAELWVDIEHYSGPGPYIRIGPPDSTGENDPIIWGMT